MRLSTLIVAIALVLLSGSAQAKKTPLGKLGQTSETSSIYSRPSANSRVYYKCKAFEYLIIRPHSNNAWLQVVLQNRQIGYIKADSVARLPYDVTEEQTKPNGASRSALPGARSAIAGYALNFVGTPYKWGGNNLMTGIDCSGFVKQLYGKIGLALPRTAAEQALVGQPITSLEELRPGDRLYFWEKRRNKIGHTGIYLGNGYFVHSSASNKGVNTDDLRKEKWRKILVAARR